MLTDPFGAAIVGAQDSLVALAGFRQQPDAGSVNRNVSCPMSLPDGAIQPAVRRILSPVTSA
jgi:hypothetical protein